MKIQINVEKKYAFLIVGLIIIIGLIIGVSAWDSAKKMWHSADDVKVSIGGNDYSLQEAINGSLIGGDESSFPQGYVETFMNLGEDNYSAGLVFSYSGFTQNYADTCDGNSSTKYNCLPNDAKLCHDAYYNGSVYSRRPVNCIARSILVNDTSIIQSSQDYSLYANIRFRSQDTSWAYAEGWIEYTSGNYRTRIKIQHPVNGDCDTGWVNGLTGTCAPGTSARAKFVQLSPHSIPVLRGQGWHFSTYWCTQYVFDEPLADTFENQNCASSWF